MMLKFLFIVLVCLSRLALAQIPMPFQMDGKQRDLLTKTYDLVKLQRWNAAEKLARSNKEIFSFVQVLRVSQASAGKYDESKISWAIAKSTTYDTLQVDIDVEQSMMPLGSHIDTIIRKYSSLDKKSIDNVQKIWRNRAMTPEEERKFYHHFRSVITSYDNDKRIDKLLWVGDFISAKRLFPKINSDQKKVFAARLSISSANNYSEVKRIISNLSSRDTSDSGVQYARVLWMHNSKQMYKEVVTALLRMPVPQHHRCQWWSISRYYIRDFLVKDSTNKMHKMAYVLASKFRPIAGPDAADAEWTAGWISLRFLNMPQNAYKHFFQLYERSNSAQTLSRAAYWAGIASDTVGNKNNKLHWFNIAAGYQTTFYGQLATAMLGYARYLELPKYQINQQTISAVSKNMAAKFLYYASILGDSSLASTMMRACINITSNPDELKIITSIPTRFSMPHVSMLGAKLAVLQRKIVLVNSLYPMHYMDHGDKSIDMALRLAVIRKESSFNKYATNPNGARGVMQLMPDTAQSIANKLAMHYSVDRLNDPHYNITLGSHYMKKALERTDNNLVMSLVIYNAGQKKLNRFVADYGDPRQLRSIHEIVDWIELLPFHETRDYIQRVIESLQVYKAMLPRKQHPIKTELVNDLLGKFGG